MGIYLLSNYILTFQMLTHTLEPHDNSGFKY